jgi:hypothetical protein
MDAKIALELLHKEKEAAVQQFTSEKVKEELDM